MIRRKSKQVICGGVAIGGGAPVTIQSMTNTDTRDVKATIKQIRTLVEAGCQIIRVAIPDMEAAEALKAIKKESPIPVVADIHFDHRLAIAAIQNGADKIRINPGNIGDDGRVRQIVEAAAKAHIPIRVGVNGGSLEKSIIEKFGGICPQGLAESAMGSIRLLEDMDFGDIVVSIKSSNVTLGHEAHLLLVARTNHPLHIGVTEAGTPERGRVKSAVGIGALLLSGIGDTLRVSLTGDPVREIEAAKEILQVCGLRRDGVNLISCPTCGRCSVNMEPIALQVEKKINEIGGWPEGFVVAIMGCEVNGPGEAKEADIGMAFGKGKAVLFKKGNVIRTCLAEEAAARLIDEMMEMKNKSFVD